MKKIISTIICLCMLLTALASCSQVNAPSEQPSESENTENSDAIVGNGFCEVHHGQFHEIITRLTNLVGDDDAVTDWSAAVAENRKTVQSDCSEYGRDVKAFIDYFNIPRETFEQYCNDMPVCIHNVDLLYSDDLEAIEEYYRDLENRNKTFDKQERLGRLKSDVIEYGKKQETYLNKTDEEKALIESKIDDIDYKNQISMLELFKIFEVDRAAFEELIQKEKEKFYQDKNSYTYRFDIVYNEDGTLKDFEIDQNKTLPELDAQFAGVENIFTD